MSQNKIRIEDESGNIFYPHTTADIVFTAEGKSVEDGLELAKGAVKRINNAIPNESGNITLDKNDIGLEHIENYPIASFEQALEAQSNAHYMSPLRTKELIGAELRPVSEGLEQASNLLDNMINVREFGAVGDGITDDTQAFIQALETANSKGGGTILASGSYNYKISQPLRIYANTTILLQGATILWYGEQSYLKPLFTNGEISNSSYAAAYDGDGNISVIGGTLDMRGTPSDVDYGSVVFAISHADGLFLKDVRMARVKNNHFMDIAGCKNVKIETCKFEEAISTGTASYECIQIDFATSTGFPLFGSSDGTPSKDILITGCTFENIYCALGHHDVRSLSGSQIYCQSIRFINNYVSVTSGDGLRLEGYSDCVISGNTIKSIGNNGITVVASRNVHIFNNMIDGTAVDGISISSKTKDDVEYRSYLVNVESNTMTNIGSSGIYANKANDVMIKNVHIVSTQQNGIFLNGIIDSIIEGCTIAKASLGGSHNGINVASCTRIRMFNNDIRTDGSSSKYGNGIRVDANCRLSELANNRVEKGANNAIYDISPDTLKDGKRMLTDILYASTGTVTLSDDLNNYDYIIIATGAVGDNSVTHSIARGWHDLGFRINEDKINVPTSKGRFRANVTAANQLTIVEAADHLRYVMGVK